MVEKNQSNFYFKYGIDYSISSPCMSIIKYDSSGNIIEIFCFSVNGKKQFSEKFIQNGISYNITNHPTASNYEHNLERFRHISQEISDFVEVGKRDFSFSNPDVVNIEGYSMGSTGKVFNIAENTQTFKLQFYDDYGSSFIEISPSSLKMFAGQKGNCGKEAMAQGFKDKFDFCIYEQLSKKIGTSPVSDIIDSIFLAMYNV